LNRRAFLGTVTGGLLAAPLAAEAQQAGKRYRIGFLGDVGDTNTGPNSRLQRSLRAGLNELGYVEGRDFVMEYRWAEGHNERLPELAADLVRAKVDVLVTAGTPGTKAAKQATQTIPVVFTAAGDVVERGIVASLARPGGNVTGLSFHVDVAKHLQLLKEVVPTMVRVAFLHDAAISTSGSQDRLESHAQALNLKVQRIAVRDPDDVALAFARIGREANGLLISGAGLFIGTRQQTCGLALQRRLPTVTYGRLFAESGCLMSLGEDLPAMYRRAAWFVDKILKGAKPADLPIEQPTTFELVINLKTAKALGLTIPPALLQRADQVIE
jgi:putative ABC transport system substrate-binding protein